MKRQSKKERIQSYAISASIPGVLKELDQLPPRRSHRRWEHTSLVESEQYLTISVFVVEVRKHPSTVSISPKA